MVGSSSILNRELQRENTLDDKVWVTEAELHVDSVRLVGTTVTHKTYVYNVRNKTNKYKLTPRYYAIIVNMHLTK